MKPRLPKNLRCAVDLKPVPRTAKKPTVYCRRECKVIARDFRKAATS